MISGQMLPILSGERIRVDQKKAPAQAILSLGSPNTNLPYLVTMETGAACQSYFTDKVSCWRQPSGWEGLRGVSRMVFSLWLNLPPITSPFCTIPRGKKKGGKQLYFKEVISTYHFYFYSIGVLVIWLQPAGKCSLYLGSYVLSLKFRKFLLVKWRKRDC